MNAITKQEHGALTTDHSSSIRTALKTSLYPGASDASVDMVLAYCNAAGLDPITKPVHIVPMWDSRSGSMRDVVMPGIGLYRTVAARTGCAGISEPEFGPEVQAKIGGTDITHPAWCRVTVRRRIASGEIVDFTAKEFWVENYAVRGGKEKSIAPNAMWAKRPYGQLAKCAEAQALRKAFPEVGAQPTAEEMEGKTLDAEQVSVSQPGHPEPTNYPATDFDKNIPKWLAAIDNGAKTADEIIAMVSTKGVLSESQIKQIKRTKAAEVVEGEFEQTGETA